MSIYFTFEVDFLPKRDVDPPLGLLDSMYAMAIFYFYEDSERSNSSL